jgi:GH25 family lysozyme M1 (1,4-beta-N-acetylmuramidase)
VTIFGWDASNHDWGRGDVDVAAARSAGISFMTHKIGEGGGYVDPRFSQFYGRAKVAGIPLLGAYYVNHPGNQTMQADHFLSLLDRQAPGWRNGPFILQVDAEKFEYMQRAPNLAEIKAFVARLKERAPNYTPVVYAPKWLYGDKLKGLGSPLWSSHYGNNPVSPFKNVYPGDNGAGWGTYSGVIPAIWQYGSRLVIGKQHACDANAFRGSLTDLIKLVHKGARDVELTDRIRLVTGKGVDYSDDDISVQGVLASTNYYVLKRAQEHAASFAELKAQNAAILAAVTDDADRDSILSAIAEASRQASERDATILDLIRKGTTGEVAAHRALELIRDALGVADAPNNDDVSVSSDGTGDSTDR